MDQQSDCQVDQTATRTEKFYQFVKKTLQFLVLVSFFSSLYSYLSGFPFFFSHNLQFSTLIFPLVARALDRKYMFLVCNGILAFLVKNLRRSSSSFNYNGFMTSAEDGVKQITELHPILAEVAVQENAASMEYMDNASPIVTAEEDDGQEEEETRKQPGGDEDDEETKTGDILWDDDDEVRESRGEEGDSAMEEVNDARVSTEELNKKFEEFIRKMKEEIRIEAQQPLITV